jgi:hypothetical protein
MHPPRVGWSPCLAELSRFPRRDVASGSRADAGWNSPDRLALRRIAVLAVQSTAIPGCLAAFGRVMMPLHSAMHVSRPPMKGAPRGVSRGPRRGLPVRGSTQRPYSDVEPEPSRRVARAVTHPRPSPDPDKEISTLRPAAAPLRGIDMRPLPGRDAKTPLVLPMLRRLFSRSSWLGGHVSHRDEVRHQGTDTNPTLRVAGQSPSAGEAFAGDSLGRLSSRLRTGTCASAAGARMSRTSSVPIPRF